MGGRFSEEPNTNPEEEQQPPDAGGFKKKNVPVSLRCTPTIPTADSQETNRRKSQTQGKYGQGTSANRPPKGPDPAYDAEQG